MEFMANMHGMFLVTTLAITLNGCFSSGFKGESPKAKEPEAKQGDTTKNETADLSQAKQAQQDQGATTPETDSIGRSDERTIVPQGDRYRTPDPVLPEPIQPIRPLPIEPIEPIKPERAQPSLPIPSQPEQTTSGSLKFNAIVFVNMEHGRHASDSGNMAVLKDSNNKVLAAGEMSLASAAVNGAQGSGGEAYPVTALNLNLSYISPDAPSSGQARLSVCPVNEQARSAKTFECSSVGESSVERPVSWKDRNVNFSRSGDHFVVNNRARGQGEQVDFGLTFSHALTMGTVAASSSPFVDASSPLVLDLNLNGKLDLVDVATHKVRFDLDNTGAAVAHGWFNAGDALLVLDINQNGRVDSGAELFGEHSFNTLAKDQKAYRSFEHGFDALAQYDSNRDGKINHLDSIYSRLQVWTDTNLNGVSEAKELQSLTAAGVASIGVKGQSTGEAFNYMRVANNEVRYLGYFVDASAKTRTVGDVWFTLDVSNAPINAKK
jgi:hypothetical protein